MLPRVGHLVFQNKLNSMLHEKTGIQVDQVTTWGGCPWIAFAPTVSELCALLLQPKPQLPVGQAVQPVSQVPTRVGDVSAQVGKDMSPINLDMTMGGQGTHGGTETAVGALQTAKLTEAGMTSHRLRGHVPFASWCGHCLKAKGIKQHRRRS